MTTQSDAPVLVAARGRPAVHSVPGAVFTPPSDELLDDLADQDEDEDDDDRAIDDDARLDAEAAELLAEAGGIELDFPELPADDAAAANDDPLARFDAAEAPPVQLEEGSGDPQEGRPCCRRRQRLQRGQLSELSANIADDAIGERVERAHDEAAQIGIVVAERSLELRPPVGRRHMRDRLRNLGPGFPCGGHRGDR